VLQAAESFGSAPGKSLSTSFRDCGLLTCFPQTEPASSVSAGQSPGRGKAQGSFVWICPASLSCIEKYRQPNNGGGQSMGFPGELHCLGCHTTRGHPQSVARATWVGGCVGWRLSPKPPSLLLQLSATLSCPKRCSQPSRSN